MATPPTGEVKRVASLLPPGRALDLACGAGRHAIWLHERGWSVTAVDRDVDAISRLLAEYPSIDSRVFDLELSPFPITDGGYDLVVCWLYFQRDLYPVIRSSLRPGGIAILCALLQGRFAAKPGELLSYFSDWIVLHEGESEHSLGKQAFELTIQRPIANAP